MKKLYCVVKCGRSVGTILTPHLHNDNCFVVSLSRFEKDYVRIKEESDLPNWVAKGYRVWMSNPSVKSHRSPSLISPGSMETEA
jgi:curli biogenesis system outer membrane secretion channel CsgG